MNWITIIPSTPDDGIHQWTIPDTPSRECLVRVSDVLDGNLSDVSDAVFTISPPTGIMSESNKIPDEYGLMDNYPNPFNSSTKIRFVLPKSDIVTLKIYDLLGHEIEILVSGQRVAGEYEVKWTANSLPGGIYICCLQVGVFVETKKLILQK